MINWNEIIRHLGQNRLQGLANGTLGYRDMDMAARNTPAAGEVRKLLRKGGIKTARSLARQACKRRNITI